MSESLKEMLIRHEGYKNKPYKCSAGKNTIGVGWNMDANPLPPEIATYLKKNGQISDDIIDRLLDISIRHAQADCRVLFPDFDTFTDRRKFALIDFLFNVGFHTASKFQTTIKHINSGKWDLAAVQMAKSLWYDQVRGRAKEICQMVKEG